MTPGPGGSAAGPELRTERLLLRRWRDSDREPFAALNADPVVMEHFPSTADREASDEMVDRIEARFETSGYGLWATEVADGGPDDGAFIGFVGLWHPPFDAHFMPAVEVGWRLAHQYWGRGYAPEGAREALRFAFDVAGLDEVISMTTVGNLRSQRVMEKIGMTRDPAGDFDHPLVEPGPHRRHVLYRISRPVPGTPAA